MRLTLAPAAIEATGLLDLPWSRPLAQWTDHRLVTPRREGLHRHVVRFIEDHGRLWAIKELPESFAHREYRVLLALGELGIPSVRVEAVIADRGPDIDAALVTGYLEYSSTYRALFSEPRGLHSYDRLLDALVQLLARLHLAGIFWGDCSLSNTLFRLDAGQLAAYLVDAETAEMHPTLSDGQRQTDVLQATESLAGELFDLQAADLLSVELDPLTVADRVERGYAALWEELTAEWLVPVSDAQQRVAKRVRRLNKLGFDLDEMELTDAAPGMLRMRVTTRVSEPGHHRRLLYQRAGLIAEENQARRLLNDLASFRAMLERQSGRPVSKAAATNRWLEDVYDPVVASIPPELRDKLDPVQVFHEVLEHRWFLSEQAGTDVGTAAAAAAYVADILPTVPDDLTSGRAPDPDADPPTGEIARAP
jgi:tRNA A-37 threonylcarbamoyl transferase component Bud32